jgi:hypothetical protein
MTERPLVASRAQAMRHARDLAVPGEAVLVGEPALLSEYVLRPALVAGGCTSPAPGARVGSVR